MDSEQADLQLSDLVVCAAMEAGMIEELDFNPDFAKKPCRVCDQMLQPCEFYPMRRVCKQCICERNKAAYRNDLDGNREAGRKRYWENPDYREAQKKRSLEVWRQKSNRLEGEEG